MTNKEGQNYMCFLPKEEETKTLRSIIQQNSSNVIVESDRRIKLKTPDELLDVLKDQCFYRVRGFHFFFVLFFFVAVSCNCFFSFCLSCSTKVGGLMNSVITET